MLLKTVSNSETCHQQSSKNSVLHAPQSAHFRENTYRISNLTMSRYAKSFNSLSSVSRGLNNLQSHFSNLWWFLKILKSKASNILMIWLVNFKAPRKNSLDRLKTSTGFWLLVSEISSKDSLNSNKNPASNKNRC